ncbi:MAG TPA: AAA family ATPase [Streptosporangiaceae bacterium]|nr:AAA family ATPase [Streptosporangiaceae bacterium]
MARDDLVGLYEVALLAGVRPSAVANWRTRHPDFPAAVAELASGPVFDRDQVQRWLRRRRTKVARTIATINLKGGVGKSTTTYAVALIMSGFFRKRVLVIDLDPQTNATAMLIGADRWLELNNEHRTLAQLFADALAPTGSEKLLQLDDALQRKVGKVQEARTIDLLPSSLDLIRLQDSLVTMPSGPFHSSVPTIVLDRAVRDLVNDYDYVLIDCPPNLGLITLNGLRIADGYIIPTIPDILSTYGIDQIAGRVAEFGEDIGNPIRPLGIVLTKVRAQSTIHRNTARQLRRDSLIPVFEAEIPEANDLAAAADYHEAGTVRQKLGYGAPFDRHYDLTKEIMEAAQ